MQLMTDTDEISQEPTSALKGTPKTDRTRRALADAAQELFSARGFENVTAEEIAAQAGVSRRTFFRHFTSKEAAVFPYNEDFLVLFRLALRQECKGGRATLAELRTAMRMLAELYTANAPEMALRQSIITQSPALIAYEQMNFLQWQRAIAEGIDGILREDGRSALGEPSQQAKIAAGAIVGAMVPTFWSWYADNATSNLAAKADATLDLIEQGFGNGLV